MSGPLSRRKVLALAAGAGAAVVAASHSPAAGSPAPAVSAVMLCRKSWGARPALPGGRAQQVTRMTLHHSEVALPDNREIIARLQQHQRYHQDARGWVDIAYHVAVDRNGNIFQLRDTAIAGDTATDYDTMGHFLVLAEGDFNREVVSEAQLNSTALVFAWAAERFGLTVNTLAGHHDFAAETTCPGTNLESHLTTGDLKQRISDLLTAGVELRTICGPEADARVAAIQTGR
ncbi:MAG TPA: peptidoglycan recognition family protein [Mycobacterium sp.]|nr:peptidoglycan recognition family protein [Mycobacterium sp.]HPZ95666.1 peptidoglycan recognition family protein [Mycobacterium sp.]HQE15743.1 peptidoglycan recognition family protein [Mycobacterium sp.]